MMRLPRGEEEYLRFPVWMQALLVVLLAAVLALAVTSVVDGWADWVVLGGIVVAVVGMMIAVNNRQYPTTKRPSRRTPTASGSGAGSRRCARSDGAQGDAGRRPRLADALARAFDGDPPMQWFLPDARVARGPRPRPAVRRDADARSTSSATGATRPRTWSAGRCGCRPGTWRLGIVQQLALLPGMVRVFGRGLARAQRGAGGDGAGPPARARTTTSTPSASCPEWQGRGIGSALMAPVLERCDRERMPAYLNAGSAAQPRAVPAARLRGHRGVPPARRRPAAVADVAQTNPQIAPTKSDVRSVRSMQLL